MRIKIILETINRNVSLDDIKSNIKILKESLIILKKEFIFLTNESIAEQRNYEENYQDILKKETLDNSKYEDDLAAKNNELEALNSAIEKLRNDIKDNKFRNQILNKKIKENEKEVSTININLKEIAKKLNFFKEKAQSIDRKTFQEIKKDLASRVEKTFLEIELSLIETDLIDANMQKNWDELWLNLNDKKHKQEDNIKDLNLKITIWQKECLENKNKIKAKENQLRMQIIDQKQLIKEISEISEKIKINIGKIKNKLQKVDDEKKEHLEQSKVVIFKKANDIITLFNQFKSFNEEIEKDLTAFLKLKAQINKFLDEYFCGKILQKTFLMENYNIAFHAIVTFFMNTYGENKYHEILQSIKQFDNYKTSNMEQTQQPSPSTAVKIEENNTSNNLFDFAKLKLAPGAIIEIIPNFQHFLQQYKSPFSYLIFTKDNNLSEVKSKNITINCYFNPVLLLADCDEKEKVIFEKLKNKIIKNNKSIVFTKDKTLGLVCITENNDVENQQFFLIDFTTLVKIPKKFISLMHDYKKNDKLGKKTCKKIAANFKRLYCPVKIIRKETQQIIAVDFEEKNKKDFEFVFANPKTQNNNIKNYIKVLDILYQDIYEQKTQLESLNDLFVDFSECLSDNQEIQTRLLNRYDQQQISETDKQNDYVQKMVKEITTILATICTAIKADDALQSFPPFHKETINNEEQGAYQLQFDQQQVTCSIKN